MKKLMLKDNRGKNYQIEDPKSFHKHLLKFHSLNGIANNSIHEENGFYFTVTSGMLEEVTSFVVKLD